MTALGMRMKQLSAPDDEYFTRYEDIEKVLPKFFGYLRHKVIYLCADNPNTSNFWKFFINNYSKIGYEEVIATYYKNDKSVITRYDGFTMSQYDMETNGDMLNEECKDIMKESHVVITNPPFSISKDLLRILKELDKDYLLIVPHTIIQHTVQELQDESVFYVDKCIYFIRDGEIVNINNGLWFTNIKGEYIEPMKLTKRFSEIEHKYIDGTDYLDIDKCCDIPYDYNKEMAVPITLFKKLSYNQFKVLGMLNHPYINKKAKFKRLVVKLKGCDE